MNVIIRPSMLEEVKAILEEQNCGGMTVSTVMGCGTQHGTPEASSEEETVKEIQGLKTTINLLPKIRVQFVVTDDKVEPVIQALREKLATGHVGDGKIFVNPIEEVVRIRTGERDEKAL